MCGNTNLKICNLCYVCARARVIYAPTNSAQILFLISINKTKKMARVRIFDVMSDKSEVPPNKNIYK
jgi:hypothetical protein